ncbi:hypothetical protein SAMN05660463_00964 [Pseudomonas sp. URIL14HWK12:I9]|nr:hypothetical protein F474_00440 [Pseudomonas sp. URIL14HWK12:I12]PVZ26916.1 hypothetical protein F470_00095 [Pseudomonas sp. URIL14HWK12:I10]PVZ37805.1 hypothetical protein F472_00440 [Pseudomonas sp. URIL14HWK12:I11]SNZ05598.1 hypothetical protein SAMN05660463_00964 [Pseudomonas sp. URIL14HWK12:I9]
MSHPVKPRKASHHVDAWATAFLVMMVAVAAVYWFGHG